MASNAFFTSSPTVVLPPNPPDQYFVPGHYATNDNAGFTTNGFADHLGANGSIPPTPGSLAGRKRSRGDVHAPDEDDQVLEDGSIESAMTEMPAKPRGKPIYGEGMTIIYPEDPGYEARPESQSGTWMDEQASREQFKSFHTKRPSISTRKSARRMDSTVSASPDDLAQLVLPPQMREITTEPLIDEATRVLGISWTRMDSSEALQINQAAYAKWIQHHYPSLNDVTIWFENSAIPGYLVAAQNSYRNQQEYYIFSQDLTEARMVTSDPAQLVPRLQLLPALHLAAPGGCITAEPVSAQSTTNSRPESMNMDDSVMAEKETVTTAVENDAKPITARPFSFTDDSFGMTAALMRSFCSAHEMEMD